MAAGVLVATTNSYADQEKQVMAAGDGESVAFEARTGRRLWESGQRQAKLGAAAVRPARHHLATDGSALIYGTQSRAGLVEPGRRSNDGNQLLDLFRDDRLAAGIARLAVTAWIDRQLG